LIPAAPVTCVCFATVLLLPFVTGIVLEKAQIRFMTWFRMGRSWGSPVTKGRWNHTESVPLTNDPPRGTAFCTMSAANLWVALVWPSRTCGCPEASSHPTYTSAGPMRPGRSEKPMVTYPVARWLMLNTM
jgi:hypothetical protein